MQNDKKQLLARREFLAKAGIGAGAFLFSSAFSSITNATQLVTKVEGINLGVITYSFRSMPSSAEDLLGYLTELDLKAVELMGDPIEAYAGAPAPLPWKRGPLSDAEKAERAKHAEELKVWRLAAPMDKFKELRKKFNNEGINIEIAKFPLDRMSPEEIDYSFKVAKTLGAKGITLERSDESVKNLAPYADKHKSLIGYHNHAKVDFNSWDDALKYSKYNAINLDIGHYVAGTNDSPIPFIKKHHDRILSIHVKDRKKNNGDNLPWGQGDTPIIEVLQLMKKEKYKFMATIELEYAIPEDSNAVKEVARCIDYCRNALS
ncbi:MAG: xylose isomerase [Thalassobius sp.]|nr:xylose isomerase [Thalassovita sp.]